MRGGALQEFHNKHKGINMSGAHWKQMCDLFLQAGSLGRCNRHWSYTASLAHLLLLFLWWTTAHFPLLLSSSSSSSSVPHFRIMVKSSKWNTAMSCAFVWIPALNIIPTNYLNFTIREEIHMYIHFICLQRSSVYNSLYSGSV